MRKRTKSKAPPETDTIYPKKQRNQKNRRRRSQKTQGGGQERSQMKKDEGRKKGEIRGAKQGEANVEVTERPEAGGRRQSVIAF